MQYDIICFSHLRWDFVYQRPQHLLSRFSKKSRIFFIEEPVLDATDKPYIEVKDRKNNLWVVVAHLPPNLPQHAFLKHQQHLIDELMLTFSLRTYILWYYSPMALAISKRLAPVLTVYDCMDELSAFKMAPPALTQFEKELFKKTDLVFTGGQSLYEAKKDKHPHVYAFPSSIDKEHFTIARKLREEPEDQQQIPHPRLGFYGVIDERLNIALLRNMALLRPSWHFILIGPVVKISRDSLPQLNNIHYLDAKHYNNLPKYLAGWDIAIMPFALNESTRYISPTKTPEYLCGGKPVISTSITDVVSPYGKMGLVHIADTPDEFVAAGDIILKETNDASWLLKVDAYLRGLSWDHTWQEMDRLMQQALDTKKKNYTIQNHTIYV